MLRRLFTLLRYFIKLFYCIFFDYSTLFFVSDY
ncbi:hypothetical protein Leryth_016184 [Lithospermum erythrorhizon]|nr:hypothetical protein Leryth_016184 [Lithospermum erythrorhizon]